MKRCRVDGQNGDDVDLHKVEGTEEAPLAVDSNVGVGAKGDGDPTGECGCKHNNIRDENSNNGDDFSDDDLGSYWGSAGEDTVENEFLEEDEEDDEAGDGEDETEASDLFRREEEVRRKFAKFVCFEEVSPKIVYSELIQLITTAQFPSLKLDINTTRSDCLQIYAEEKPKIKNILNNMGGSIALSVDVLTYSDQHDSNYDYLCIAAHFVDDDWKLKKWVLSFRRHNTSDSDFIDKAILKVLKEWNIEDKVAFLTSREYYWSTYMIDETVDIIKAVVKEKRTLPLDSCLFSVRCVTEAFSLMAGDAFGKISDIIDKIQELHWSKSESMWHLTNSKLKDALDLLSLGEFKSCRKKRYFPSANEWEKVRIVHRLVESAYNVAKQVFATKYPTANKFLYNLQELRAVLVQESTSADSFTSDVAKKLLESLEKYLKDAFLLLAIAAVMDPRFKMQYVEYMSSKFDQTDGSFRSAPVLDAIRSLFAEYTSHDVKTENPESASDFKVPNEGWLQEYNQFVQSNNQPQKSDLDLYLEEPVTPWRDDFNTLLWWKSEAPKYPVVAKMARDILAVPVSVSTSYDAYYYLENKHPDLTLISSGAELANALACCRSWPKNYSS